MGHYRLAFLGGSFEGLCFRGYGLGLGYYRDGGALVKPTVSASEEVDDGLQMSVRRWDLLDEVSVFQAPRSGAPPLVSRQDLLEPIEQLPYQREEATGHQSRPRRDRPAQDLSLAKAYLDDS